MVFFSYILCDAFWSLPDKMDLKFASYVNIAAGTDAC